MGLMKDAEGVVKLLMDEDVTKGQYIGCHPCINTSSIKIKTEDMINIIIPEMKHEITYVKL